MERTNYAIPISYISPSSLAIFYKNREEWALRYALPSRPPRMPQTHQMALGSAFDAYCKSYLASRLKVNGWSSTLSFERLFEKQVEPQCRDLARVDGGKVFKFYCDSGAMANLCLELERAVEEPTFEADVAKEVHLDGRVSYKLFGKTDLSFKVKSGGSVVYDWKCNGFYSSQKPSPKKGYVHSLPTGKMHRHATPLSFEGIIINGACKIEDVDPTWAEQLVIYGWSLGAEVGSQFVVGIDQIIGAEGVYMFRSVPGTSFQNIVHERCVKMWEACLSGWVFDNVSFEENLLVLERLERENTVSSTGEQKERDLWLNQISRSAW